MAELSIDRREFARLCAMEIQRAAKLAGTKMPDPDFVREIALDMASSHALSRVPCSRVAELFSLARSYYAETPLLRHLVKAWDNHMKPQAEAPAPKDAPKLAPPPELAHSEAQMRHLAAVRTSLAEGGHMAAMATCEKKTTAVELCEPLQAEDWMFQLLELDPSRGEVEAMARACTLSSLVWYKSNPDRYPCWGKWLNHYGI